jgi:hypothetical protein
MGFIVRVSGGARAHAGEFTRHGLAKNHGTGGARERNTCSIAPRPVALVEGRTHLRGHVGRVDHVLHTDRDAKKGLTPRATTIQRPRLLQSVFAIQKGPGMDMLFSIIDALKTGAYHVLGFCAASNRLRELGRR